jgi:hypothetical protein
MTPSTSSNTISSSHQQGYDSDSTTLSTSVAQGPSPRRVKKNVPGPLHPASVAPNYVPSESRTPRQRSDSTSASELGSPGHTRHHTRSHTGGSVPRMTGEMITGTEQLNIHSQRMPGVSKMKSRETLGIPFHSAPVGPLPPTPTTLGPPPSTPPPMPTPGSAPGSTPSTPSHSNPTTPSLPGHQTFLPLPTSPPPRSPLPQTPSSNPVSPPASPAHATRRISPLVPSNFSVAGHLHQNNAGHTSSPLQKSFLSPQESSPENSNGTANGGNVSSGAHSQVHEGEPTTDEWLPNLSSGYDSAHEHGSEDPYPRERVSSKGTYQWYDRV